MLVFSVLLLMMVGVVFVYSPAIILESICGSKMFWIIAIFVYYIIATLLPIDKIIGKVYPLFAISLLFMAAALMIGLIVKMPASQSCGTICRRAISMPIRHGWVPSLL